MKMKKLINLFSITIFILALSSLPKIPDSPFNLKKLGSLPVLHEGRLKPLNSALTSIVMMGREKQYVKSEDNKIVPIAWFLTLITDPETAHSIPFFLIDHPQVKGVINHAKSKKKVFSLNDIHLKIILFIVLLICISSDIGGILFGKFFKGPKLTKISPNKTYSGVIGGFLLSLAAGLFFLNYTNTDFLENDSTKILLAILFISLISQIGDLIISYFKRLAKIKDTGKILPGHGGLLDRIDGIIFAVPVSYLLFNYLS